MVLGETIHSLESSCWAIWEVFEEFVPMVSMMTKHSSSAVDPKEFYTRRMDQAKNTEPALVRVRL